MIKNKSWSEEELIENSEMARLIESIKKGEPISLPHQPICNVRPTNLVVSSKDCLEEVTFHLRTKTDHFLALTGPARVGKSTLAQNIAYNLRENFYDGVFYISLSAARSAAMAIDSISNSLGEILEREKPLSGSLTRFITECLDRKEILLVLDDIDKVKDLHKLLSELKNQVDSNSNLYVLVTCRDYSDDEFSRSDYWIYHAQPLAIPGPEKQYPLNDLIEYESIKLFIHYVRRINHKFQLNNENASTIIEICKLLDGIPQAIRDFVSHLVALKAGTTAQELADLEEQFKNDFSRLPHYLGFEAVLESSFENMTDDERELLEVLSVFTGGFTRVTIKEFLSTVNTSLPWATSGVLQDTLSLLGKKSLVLSSDNSPYGARLMLLASTREYLSNKVDPSRIAELQFKHAKYFADKEELYERKNIQSAWQYMIDKQLQYPEDKDINELIIQYTGKGATYPLSWPHGFLNHTRQIRAILRASSRHVCSDNIEKEKQHRKQYMLLLGKIWDLLPELESDLDFYEDFIKSTDRDTSVLPRALLGMGTVYDYLAQFGESFAILAQLCYGEVLEQAEGDQYVICRAHASMADSDLLQNDIEFAIIRYEKTIQLAKEICDKDRKTSIIRRLESSLGFAYLLEHKLEAAEEHLTKAFTRINPITDQRSVAILNWGFGHIEVKRNNFDRAVELMRALPDLMAKEQHPDTERYVAQLAEVRRQRRSS